MKAPSLTSRILLVLAATLMLMLSASLAWAAVNDYRVRGIVPNGVTLAGHDLSGMTEAQARDEIQNAVSAPLLRPITVTGDNKTWTFDPKGLVSVDVESMLDEAYSTRRAATFVNRLDSQLRGTPLTNQVKPKYTVDASGIAAWVAQTSAGVDRKSVDATRSIVNYQFKVKKSRFGEKVDQVSTTQQIVNVLSSEGALSGSDRSVALAITPIKPKVTEDSFKRALIVSLAQCKIRLYEGAKLVKTYSCAPGRPAYPTPTGDFYVQSKQRYAAWYNPGTAWAKSMPKMIPGGPGNPMGTTKIGINYSGVFMHGVPPGEYSSIGTHASHGCMRMMPSAVLDLYGRVSIGDPVYIRY